MRHRQAYKKNTQKINLQTLEEKTAVSSGLSKLGRGHLLHTHLTVVQGALHPPTGIRPTGDQVLGGLMNPQQGWRKAQGP